ncbi:MAG: aminoacyl--tRNA ligase-related protein [Acidobacteriaceae bacterium]
MKSPSSLAQRVSVMLDQPATEMAQEELPKQIAFLAQGIREIRFSGDGREVSFALDSEPQPELQELVRDAARRMQRGLRQLKRKIVFSSSRMASPRFKPVENISGVHAFATGIVALEGLPLKLFRYFDRSFIEFGKRWNPAPLMTPTLIPSDVLAKCDYFRSFPHNVTFACHLTETAENIAGFRAHYQEMDHLDDQAVSHLATPEACLSPAVCYHTYCLNQNKTLPAEGLAYEIVGKCFRYEASNLTDLRRLWDFTMREIVFLGERESILEKRAESITDMGRFLEEHELAGEIRTASDPFFVAPDAISKTYFQLSSETKFEISLLLPNNERVAVGSHNYHSDFFGRAFNTTVEGHGAMHSVCVAFGLERWVHAFLQQHGDDINQWPAVVRTATEFAQEQRAQNTSV